MSQPVTTAVTLCVSLTAHLGLKIVLYIFESHTFCMVRLLYDIVCSVN